MTGIHKLPKILLKINLIFGNIHIVSGNIKSAFKLGAIKVYSGNNKIMLNHVKNPHLEKHFGNGINQCNTLTNYPDWQ